MTKRSHDLRKITTSSYLGKVRFIEEFEENGRNLDENQMEYIFRN